MSEVPLKIRWLEAVASRAGPPGQVTRHVLHVLALHMDKRGRAFPGEALLARRCALSERAVRTHLAKAERQGWITRQLVNRNQRGAGWGYYEYQARFPEQPESHSGYQPERDSACHDSNRNLMQGNRNLMQSNRNLTTEQPERGAAEYPHETLKKPSGNIPQSTPAPRERGGPLEWDGQLPDYANEECF